jgi:hypothetical protein
MSTYLYGMTLVPAVVEFERIGSRQCVLVYVEMYDLSVLDGEVKRDIQRIRLRVFVTRWLGSDKSACCSYYIVYCNM